MRGWIVPKRAKRTSRRTCGGVLKSASIPRSAPCRASVRPHLSRRQIWMAGRVTRSDLPPRMDRHESAHDRLDPGALEAGCADHPLELRHRGEAANRFDQVAIAFGI